MSGTAEMMKKDNRTTSYEGPHKAGDSQGTDAAGRRKDRTFAPGRMLALLAAAAGIPLLICAALVVWIDPFFHYHRPLSWFPYQVDHQLSQNPGMARHMDYDSIITGSSMTVNFNTRDFRDLLGLNALKLSYDGATPKDISNILSIVYDEDNPERQRSDVRQAFIAIDILSYTADPDETKYPIPEYLYNRNPFDDVNYLFNKDVLLDYIVAPAAGHKDRTDLSFVYGMTWLTPDLLGEDYVKAHYSPVPKSAERVPDDLFIEGTDRNLETNILPYIKAHPETEFTFFFPPVSILFWNDFVNENSLDARLLQCEDIGETLLSCPNVRVFFFMDEKDVVEDLDYYTDTVHFTPEISTRMVQCFRSGQDEVSAGGMKQVLQHMRELVMDYPFDS